MYRVSSLMIAAAILAVAPAMTDSVQAQGLNNAYQFGYGYGLGYKFANKSFVAQFPGPNAQGNFAYGPFPNVRAVPNNRRFHHGHFGYGRGFRYNPYPVIQRGLSPLQEEKPPYFASFPPVHYDSNIVRRPYGVSPFAAPPGIAPVEMQFPASPTTVVNPYFESEVAPSAPAEEKSPSDEKSDQGT